MSFRPCIALTAGDPAGVGPEILRALLAAGSLPDGFEYDLLGMPSEVVAGVPTAAGARAAFDALEQAVAGGLSGRYAAVVTGPIHKARMREVGFSFPGQTEFFATRCQCPNHAMLLTGGRITVALVTAHVPLRDVSSLLSVSEITRVGLLLADFLALRLGHSPRIAVAGLNPHAGESGLLGHEEQAVIAPAVEALGRSGRARFSGPHSPDTLFHRVAEGEFDGVLCMYHDQGLIPLKLAAFHEGVNVTLGLPFPRTSPDHGTAFEIAGKGQARPESMLAAVRLAAELATRRVPQHPPLGR
ncbi:MAG: 4-hydroxythreonine-4-phosphate dehydrogenase PdxA [Verrucomicrobiota bacterium]